MMELTGKSVCKGTAMGPVLVIDKRDFVVKRRKIQDAGAELERLERAVELSGEQLQALYEKARAEVGEASAAIF